MAASLCALLTAPAIAQTPEPDAGPNLPDATALLPRDLSPWGMFLHADIVVKMVLVGLALASVVTWTVLLAKSVELASAKRRVNRHLRALRSARALAEVNVNTRGPVATLIVSAERELDLSRDMRSDGIKERIALQLERIEVAAGRHIGRGMGALATIGATAPFVGLFGTVWGIMNSFIGISKAHTTNLAVVAPGIAEALLATAFGLIAAVPAVVIYNMFARSISGYRALLADASAQIIRHVSRDLDRRRLSLPHAAE
ncbi:MAG: tonB-system energizer ExbB [Bradyrhizobiaceae bacterium]|nr:tonB-system energizer ExbB [Bradyrhizobiaceae bacterium]